METNRAVRRTTVSRTDAARRWDQAYLHLLRWAAHPSQESPQAENLQKEVSDARGDLRSGLDLTPGAGPGD